MPKQKQIQFKKVGGWGGKRKGAGRPNLSGTVNHMSREKVDFKKPLHITLKLNGRIKKTLRGPMMLSRLKECLKKAKAIGLRVIHFSVQMNHIHILAECRDNEVLDRGMKSLGCSLGKAIRKSCGENGPVFNGRFHLHVLKSPREMKNGLGYVLLNHSKHDGLIPYSDRFSSAAYFNEWKELLGRNIGPLLMDRRRREAILPPYLSPPKSWLAREGWRKVKLAAHGPSLE
jgi:REP element-mobilizing transposase RayT